MKAWKYHWKSAFMRLPCTLADAWCNRGQARSSKRVLIARHVAKRSYTYRDFLAWVSRHVPELRARMEFRHLPIRNLQLEDIGLLASWTSDTMDTWSPSGHRQAMQLTLNARSLGIPIINATDAITQATKVASTQAWRSAGLLAPRCELLTGDSSQWASTLQRFETPFLIRDARGHGRPSFIIRSDHELHHLPWSLFNSPMACEFVETCSESDGLYRKYRCIVAGQHAIPRHMIANDHWEVRPEQRVASDRLRSEELAFVNSKPVHHDQLVYACQLLDLDVAGIDYSIDADGRMILWEANPVPNLNAPPSHRAAHIMPAVERSYAAIAKLYLNRLEVKTPVLLERLLDWPQDCSPTHVPNLSRGMTPWSH